MRVEHLLAIAGRGGLRRHDRSAGRRQQWRGARRTSRIRVRTSLSGPEPAASPAGKRRGRGL